MNVAKFDASLCQRCDQCHASMACPKEIIQYHGSEGEPGNLLEIDTKLCLGCGKCERYCPGKAVTMQ